MKKRRALQLTVFSVVFLIGIPTVWLVREYRQEQFSQYLVTAIEANDLDSVRADLKAGADPNTRGQPFDMQDYNSPLSFGERCQRFLTKFMPPHSSAAGSFTPLMVCLDANYRENPALVNALLDAGADPNLASNDSEAIYPLLRAARDGQHPQTLRILIRRGGNPRLKDTSGRTALHYAAMEDNVEDIPLLLYSGPLCQDTDGTIFKLDFSPFRLSSWLVVK